VECEICGQEVDNSEDLQKHKERLHPVSQSDDSSLEKPDLMDETSESEPDEVPETAQRRQ
jgi:hypothetical protein